MRRRGLTAGLCLLAAAAGCAVSQAQRERNLRKAIAVELVRQRDWDTAMRAVQELVAGDPTDVDVLLMRGLILRERGLPEEAERDFRDVIARDDDRADAHSALAVLLDNGGRGEEAFEHHRRARELAPENPEMLNNLGFALYARGRTEEAIATLKEAVRVDPTNPRARNNLGFAYARAKDFGRAEREFAAGGTPAQARNNLGFAYLRAGSLTLAYDLFLDALRLDPELGEARANLAAVAATLGRPVPEPFAAQQTPGGTDALVQKVD